MSPQHNKLSSSPTVLCHFYSIPIRPGSHPGSAYRSGSTRRSVYSSKKISPPKTVPFQLWFLWFLRPDSPARNHTKELDSHRTVFVLGITTMKSWISGLKRILVE
ncbi:hypothetical protein TorRG33x02_057310 [Trema orientale]|uniref:Uncharacterized protein n=1 Tax=Trema orientale TaxID=63057 RepID=A0A2P5FL25_TREOI|nr:hypothetical protein TorRG33x02_057310 [Trema orientale]